MHLKPNKINMLPERVYTPYIRKDLLKKMVFIGGPRQVGKTTLGVSLLNNYYDGHPAYLNWDQSDARSIIQKGTWPKDEPLIIFDEIHKRKGWQNFVKGIWDKWRNTQRFIVTGSARLDVFRKGGDSMLGRDHYYRIHPFTLPELGYSVDNLSLLFKFGGFPEPLLSQDETELRRWHLQRVSNLVRIDLCSAAIINVEEFMDDFIPLLRPVLSGQHNRAVVHSFLFSSSSLFIRGNFCNKVL